MSQCVGHGLTVGDVGIDPGELGVGVLPVRGLAATGCDDTSALLGKALSGGPSDAAACSCDKSGLAFEPAGLAAVMSRRWLLGAVAGAGWRGCASASEVGC
jgi:hypothetical protein